MSWISINPKSEPPQAVNAAAAAIGADPQNITPVELAEAYNQVEEYTQAASQSTPANTGSSWNAKAWDDIFSEEDEE
jgi:hypothetical protein